MLLQSGLKFLQGPVLGSLGNRPEGIDLGALVPEGHLATDDGGHIIGGVEHDLAEEHVLEGKDGGGVVLGGEPLQGLKEVRVGGLEVLLLGMEDAGLDIKRRLEERGAIDGVGGGAGRGEGGLGLGDIPELEADLGLEELHLDQEHLVIQPLELGEERANELEGLGELPVVQIEGNEPGLERLPQVDPLLLRGPGNTLLAQQDLLVPGARDLGQEVNQGFH